VLILGLLAVVRCGEGVIVKAMSMMVYPFIAALAVSGRVFDPALERRHSRHRQHPAMPSVLLHTLWLAIPVMVFSFNHSPIISAFAVDQKAPCTAPKPNERSSQILATRPPADGGDGAVLRVQLRAHAVPGNWPKPRRRTCRSCPTWPTTSATRPSPLPRR
jgi:hypothetical protein